MATRALGMDVFRRELLKGSTETLILSLLAGQSMYGYQLLREMDKRSSGYFRLKEGTLYPALHRLAKVGLVRSEWAESPNGQLRRYYHVTQVGHEKLRSMLREWDLFTKAVSLISAPVSPNPPKDTDGRREDSGRGWVRELQGRWPGVLG